MDRTHDIEERISKLETKLDQALLQNAELQKQNAELQKQNAELQKQNAELQKQNAELQIKIEKLEEHIRTNSNNSSKPPSGDIIKPKKPKKGTTKNKGRRQGAQEGHKGQGRPLIAESEVTQVVPCLPSARCDCGQAVEIKNEVHERHQLFEIPKIKPDVTEYQIFEGICAFCGKIHRGDIPQGVPLGILGHRAMGIIAILSGKFHLSKRHIETLLLDLFGRRISIGTISNTEDKVSEALEASVHEAREYTKEQSQIHVDETGHLKCGKRGWLWVAATFYVTVFMIRMSRSAKVAKELLGEVFKGIIISDRYPAYNWIDVNRRQLCWAHIIRDFQKIKERQGISSWVGDKLLLYTQEMFSLWHLWKQHLIQKKQFEYGIYPLQVAIEAMLTRGASCGLSKTEKTCKQMLKYKEALWTFIESDGVEPTNNFAERQIRPYVLWRKNCYGTQSERGNRFIERIMTVCASLKQQDRNVLDFLTQTMRAHYTKSSKPSLIPHLELESLPLAA